MKAAEMAKLVKSLVDKHEDLRSDDSQHSSKSLVWWDRSVSPVFGDKDRGFLGLPCQPVYLIDELEIHEKSEREQHLTLASTCTCTITTTHVHTERGTFAQKDFAIKFSPPSNTFLDRLDSSVSWKVFIHKRLILPPSPGTAFFMFFSLLGYLGAGKGRSGGSGL